MGQKSPKGDTPVDSGRPAASNSDGCLRTCPRCRAEVIADDPLSLVQCIADRCVMVRPRALKESDGDPFLGARIADRFALLGRIGAGSMGTVYRARHESMGRDVAIKILRSDRAFDSQAKARFAREARAMSLLRSPHTVTVYDFGETPDPGDDELGTNPTSLYLAMELLDGESLGQRLKRVGRMSVPLAINITRQALRSLAEAHDKGVIHRDLKPDNLLLVPAEAGEQDAELVKVLDFGIAKVLDDQPIGDDVLETQAGTVFGTPRFMSPEQAQAKPLDARSDLYSLGVLLYQMLVGHPPFRDDDAVVVMAHHIKTVPVAPRDEAPDARIPMSLSNLVMRVLSKDPNERPETAKAFGLALDAVERTIDDQDTTDELSALARSNSDRPPADVAAIVAWLRRMPKGAVVVASAFLTLGLGSAVIFASGSGPEPLEVSRGVARYAAARFAATRSSALSASWTRPTERVAAEAEILEERPSPSAPTSTDLGRAGGPKVVPGPPPGPPEVSSTKVFVPPTKPKYTRFE